MDLNYIREFVTLAETGNFLDAADRLNMTQSTLSRHIKALEEEMGTLLFLRSTRKVMLSEFGKRFQPIALDLTQLQHVYQKELFHYKSALPETISIGSIPSVTEYNLTDLLENLQQDNPGFALNWFEGEPPELLDMLRNDQLDFAILRNSRNLGNEFQTFEIAKDTLNAVMPKSHSFSCLEKLALADLREEPLLFLAESTFMYRLCMQACMDAGFVPHISGTGRHSDQILNLVERGKGIALLSEHPLRGKNLSEFIIRELTPQISTSIQLIYCTSHHFSEQANTFLESVKKVNTRLWA